MPSLNGAERGQRRRVAMGHAARPLARGSAEYRMSAMSVALVSAGAGRAGVRRQGVEGELARRAHADHHHLAQRRQLGAHLVDHRLQALVHDGRHRAGVAHEGAHVVGPLQLRQRHRDARRGAPTARIAHAASRPSGMSTATRSPRPDAEPRSPPASRAHGVGELVVGPRALRLAQGHARAPRACPPVRAAPPRGSADPHIPTILSRFDIRCRPRYIPSVRIIGGVLGGRRIRAPRGDATRPTADRVREAVFNILALPPPDGRGCSTSLPAAAPSGSRRCRAARRGRVVAVDRREAVVDAGNARDLGVASRLRVRRAAPALGRCPARPDLSTWCSSIPRMPPIWPRRRWPRCPRCSPPGPSSSSSTIAAHRRILDRHRWRSMDRRRYGDTAVSFYSPRGRAT